MKKGLLAVIVAAVCTMGLTGCDRVEPGYVGIKVNKLGEDKGIGEVVGVGQSVDWSEYRAVHLSLSHLK